MLNSEFFKERLSIKIIPLYINIKMSLRLDELFKIGACAVMQYIDFLLNLMVIVPHGGQILYVLIL